MSNELFQKLFDNETRFYLDMKCMELLISENAELMYTPVGDENVLPLVFVYNTNDDVYERYRRDLLPIVRLFKKYGYDFDRKGNNGMTFIDYINHITLLNANNANDDVVFEEQKMLLDEINAIINK